MDEKARRQDQGEMTTIESEDLQKLIRGQNGDDDDKPTDKKDTVDSLVEEAEKTSTPETERAEPEIEVQGERRPTSEVPTSQRHPDLEKALSTIEGLQREVSELRGAHRTSTPTEPTVETYEPIRGIRLPKDRNMWPIRLSKEDVQSVGLDPEVAEPLEVLGNALIVYLDRLASPTIRRTAEEVVGTRGNTERQQAAFYNAFPDLVYHQDLVELVEARARNMDRIHERIRNPQEYLQEVGRRARARIAHLRGETPEQYEQKVRTWLVSRGQAPASRQSASRAVTVPTTGNGATRAGNRSTQDKEMLDLL